MKAIIYSLMAQSVSAGILYIQGCGFKSRLDYKIWPVRISASSPAFHAGKRGSTPLQATKLCIDSSVGRALKQFLSLVTLKRCWLIWSSSYSKREVVGSSPALCSKQNRHVVELVDTAVIYVFNRLLLRKNVVDLKFIVNIRGPQNWRFESFCADNIFISMM